MNADRFRLVFSQHIGMFVPAAENVVARGRQNQGKRARLRRQALATAVMAAFAGSINAAPPALTALPINGVIKSGAGSIATNGSAMTVNQTTNKMIINWGSFNIGSAASVNFAQPGSTSAVLNRVTGTDISQIYGSLGANGQVYLINPNGIVFGSGSQVNVNSLVASSLNVPDWLFNQGITSQTNVAASFAGSSGFVQVDPGATITAASGGKVMMFAPTVTNSGLINTPDGQTLLAAGQKVYLASSGEANLRGLLVEVDSGGTTTNLGQIVAQRGNITLAGIAVNQNGRVIATTSVNANGSIKLQARDTVDVVSSSIGKLKPTVGGAVSLGANSTTEVLPDYGNTATVLDSQTVQPSSVDVSAANIHLMNNAWIVAPSGNVSLYAGLNPSAPTLISSNDAKSLQPNASRIYFDSGSGIDVSGIGSGSTAADRAGEQAASVSVASNIVSAQLRGTELADSPLQRSGVLYKATVYADARKTGVNGDVGTSVANVSGYTSQIGHTVSERLAKGGTVSVQSEGDVIFNAGASINVSGGKVNYTGDTVNVTKLVAASGQVYDIANAPKDIQYVAVKNVTRQEKGYTQGADAGSVSFVAPGMVLNGSLKGNVTAGIYQRAANKLPAGASLQIGQPYTNSNVLHSAIVFDAQSATSAAPAFGDPMSADALSVLHLGSGFYAASGFRNLNFNADGQITVQQGSNLQVQPGGSITLNGGGVDVQGNLVARGGNISLSAALTNYGFLYGTNGTTNVHVSGSSTLDTSGLWTNDLQNPLGSDLIAVSGGTISLSAASQDGRPGANVILDSGSLLNASGGAWLDSTGKLTSGNGGAIKLAASGGHSDGGVHDGSLTLNGNLRADSLATGGSLSLVSGSVTIGGAPVGSRGETWFSPSFFLNGGFTSYSIAGYEGVTLANNTSIAPAAWTRVLDRGYALQASGSDIANFSHTQLWQPTGAGPTRKPASLSLSASTQTAGTLTLGQGSAITVDPGASVNLYAARQLTALGSITAHGGAISMALGHEPNPASDAVVNYDATQTLWLGSQSVLDVSGIANIYSNTRSLRVGTVMDGGSITLDAQKGTVVAESGAVLNLDGTHAMLDLRQSGASYKATDIASKGGSLSISALEGVLFDAAMSAHGGSSSVAAGSFSLSLYKAFIAPTGYSQLYPTGDRVITLQQTGSAVSGLTIGGSTGSSNSGKVYVFADKLAVAGFDNVALTSPNTIRLSGNLSVATRGALTLDAPNLILDNGVNASLSSGYVGIGNSSRFYQGSDRVYTPVSGSGILNVSGKYVDLFGNLDLSGASQASFASAGDLQLRGELVNDTTNLNLAGSLQTAGNLTFSAARIYPSTLSNYTIHSSGSNATVTFSRNGNDPGVPYSVLGSLTVQADNIVQGGVLRAPFGVINLAANKQLTLQNGSLTSVSAEGKTLPFGMTVNGTSWTYDFGDRTRTFSTLPDKSISLNGNVVNIAAGSKVDVSGGGDLQAWEFTPGTGGSTDVLAASGVFAIIPGLGVNYMPGNSQSYNDTTVKPGDMVYLSGGNGLAAGYYLLLPAHYALLNGAYTVKVVAGTQDMVASQNTTGLDGSRLMSGYLLQSGGITANARSAGFLVAPGSVARTQSELTDTLANAAFASAYSAGGLTGYRLPVDAGRLSMSAISNLTLDGTMQMTHASGTRGAEVDINSSNIAISGDGSTVSGYLTLDSAKLNTMGAESLLIGGTRSNVADGTQINVAANNVKLVGGANLSGQEILLAAKNDVSVGSGTSISGSGKASLETGSLIIGDSAVSGSGEGALLRVSSDGQRGLIRHGVGATPATGTLEVQSGALVAADGSIILDATYSNQLGGNIQLAKGGALRIGAPAINIGSPSTAVTGLLLDGSKLAALGNAGNLALKSYSTINFYGAPSVGSSDLQSLTLESAGLVGYGNAGGTVALHARTVEFSNPDNAVYSPSGVASSGTLSVSADDQIIVGANTFKTSGFGKVALTAGNQVIGQGTGGLNVAGDLSIDAGRMTVAGRANQVIAASGKLTTSAHAPAQNFSDAALGGQLTLMADTIVHGGVIDMPAGTVTLQATGASGGDTLALLSGSVIHANGVARKLGAAVALADGGTVSLKTVNGNIRMDGGAIMDVSASGGAAAGTIKVDSAGSTNLGGTLTGGAAGGNGVAQPTQGSFNMRTATLADFSALNNKLEAGGFNQKRDIRVKNGDINVASTDTVTAHEVTLTADDGNLTVAGKINASGSKGGTVILNAGQVAGDGKGVLTLASTATIDASATTASTESAGSTGNGGKVILNVVSDRDTSDTSGSSINAVAGSVINVSGAGKGRDGKVILRAPRTGISNNGLAGNGMAVTAFGTTVLGAQASIVAEGVKVYKSTSDLTMDSGYVSTMSADNANFLGANTVASNLGLASDSRFSVAAGDEVRSAGSITVTGDMDVHTWGLGALTLRAAKDINVNANISAGFTAADNSGALISGGVWNYRMAAGADLSSAGMLETNNSGMGNFTLGTGDRIRTGTGDINIAAGGNFALTDATSVIYTAGTPDAANYPVNGGDISMRIKGNITGAASGQLPTDWLYRKGYLSADGTYITGVNRRGPTYDNPAWWPVFSKFAENVGALGGGNVSISAGGNINQLSAVIATNGRVIGTGPANASLVVNGGGDLTVRAGGDIVGGLYMDDKGTAVIRSGGSLLADGSGYNAMFALGDAKLDVAATGDVGVMTVFNPTLTKMTNANKALQQINNQGFPSYFSTYSTNSSATLTSIAGGVKITNSIPIAFADPDLTGAPNGGLLLYPGTLKVSALGGNVEIDNSMVMLPATNGDLQLAASQSLYFVPSNLFSLNMSDMDLANIPSVLSPISSKSSPSFMDMVSNIINDKSEGAVFHAATPVHQNDANPVVLYAGVDIVGSSQYVSILLPKKASVYAGNDIKNLALVGQNLNNSDVTTITAGHDLYYTPTYNADGTSYGYSFNGITWSGPGYLDVAAGRNINLSNAYGIVTRGNLLNPYLPDTGASLSVLVSANGANDAAFIAKYLDPAVSTAYSASMISFVEAMTGQSGLTPADAWTTFQGLSADVQHQFVQKAFFNELEQNAISNASASVKSYDRGHAAIATLFPSSGSYSGNLDLSFSQLKTERGGDLNVLAPGGDILVGLPKTPQQLLTAKANNPANASASSLLGMFTVKGGNINTYSSGSVEVAQSRVFTVAGGDILMWSNNGDVDAGKGSKTATSAPPPLVRTDTNGNTVVDLSGVVTGSGIGTLQTVAGAPPGNVYLIAPTGTINAGDAGVRSSGKIIADAAHVANADNFQAAGGMSGVPHADSGSVSFNVGGLTDSSASAAAKSGDALARQQAANSALGNQSSFMPSFITVEVIGFGNSGGSNAAPADENSNSGDDKRADRKKRG